MSTPDSCTQKLEMDDEDDGCGDDEFVWEDYLEEIKAESVPPTAFVHVEQSLESCITSHQVLEVVNECLGTNGETILTYWLAKVVATCGPLLRLNYICSKFNHEFWQEIPARNLHPLGYCEKNHIPLALPEKLDLDMQSSPDGEEEKKAFTLVREAQRENNSVPAEALGEHGYRSVDAIKPGMKLEVLSELEPYCGWLVTVNDNVGGRLLLRYDSPDCAGPLEWIFYKNPRIKPPKWIALQGSPWRYKCGHRDDTYCDEEWDALLEMGWEDARRAPVPMSLLEQQITEANPNDGVLPGMFVECVDMKNPYVIHAAHVIALVDEFYFWVEIISREAAQTRKQWITSLDDPFLLPCGFCEEHNIALITPEDWSQSENASWETYAHQRKQRCLYSDRFPAHVSAKELEFNVGHKLEAVDPLQDQEICVASIVQATGHLLWIVLESEADQKEMIYPVTSMKLFPAGWCQTNNYPLKLPAAYLPRRHLHYNQEEKEKEDSNGETSQNTNQQSSWCPKIYVNHRCFLGPFLSKSRVAKLSQSIGPGSVELVLREIVGTAISAAYIPTRVLRELEHIEAPSSTWKNIMVKAKFKNYSYTGTVAIATVASDVEEFLRGMCQTLQSCPNLWSYEQTGEGCPLLCNSTQLKIHPFGYPLHTNRGRGRGTGSRGARGRGFKSVPVPKRRKRGRRKRLFTRIRNTQLMRKEGEDLQPSGSQPLHLDGSTSHSDIPFQEGSVDVNEEEEGDDDEEIGSGSDDTSSRSSRPTSPLLSTEPGSSGRKRYQKREWKDLPRTEIQTRGVKLPDYATQMRVRTTTKRKLEGGDSCVQVMEQSDNSVVLRKESRVLDEPVVGNTTGLEAAIVTSDPLEWTIHDVRQYVSSQPAICHHAVRLQEQEIDGRAFLLLNLPTLIHHFGLPHEAAVVLAQHVCKVKLAHFLYFYNRNES